MSLVTLFFFFAGADYADFAERIRKIRIIREIRASKRKVIQLIRKKQ